MAGAVLVLLSLAVVGSRPALERRLAAALPGWIEDATGCEARTGPVSVRYLLPRASVTDLVIDCGDAARLAAPKLAAGVRLLPLLGGHVALRRVEITGLDLTWRERPPGLGAPGGAAADGPAWSFSAGAVDLVDGRLRYEEPDLDLTLVLEGIRVASDELFDGRQGQASLTVASADVAVDAVTFEDVRVDLEMGLDGGLLEVTDLVAVAPGIATVRGRGTASLQERPYRYLLDLEAVGEGGALQAPLALPAWIRSPGAARWQGRIEGTGTDWRIVGDASLEAAAVDRVTLRDVRAGTRVTSRAVELSPLGGDALDGRLAGEVRFGRAPDGWTATGTAGIEGADLDAAAALYLGDLWPELGVRVDASADGKIRLAEIPVADADVEVAVYPASGRGPGGLAVPVGLLRGRLEDDRLVIRDGHVAVAAADVDVEGTLTVEGELEGHAALDVPSLSVTLDAVNARFPVPFLEAVKPAGALGMDGDLSGSLRRPRLDGRLEGFGLRVRDIHLGTVSGRVSLTPDGLKLADLRVEGDVLRGRVDGAIGLGAVPALDLEAQVESLQLADLGRAAGLPVMVTGTVSGEVRAVSGPRGPEVRTVVDILSPGVRSWLDLDHAAADLLLDADGVEIRRMTAVAEATELTGTGRLPWGAGGETRLDVKGHLGPGSSPVLELLDARATVSASLRGPLGLQGLDGEARFDVDLAARHGLGPWHLRGQAVLQDGALDVEADESLTGLSLDGRLAFQERLPVRLEARAPTFETVLMADPVSGPITLTTGALAATVTGDLADPETVRSAVHLDSVIVEGGGVAARSTMPVELSGAGPRLTLPVTALAIGPQELFLSGSVTLSEEPVYELNLQGESDLRLFRPLIPEARMAGQAAISVHIRGKGVHPRVTGSLDVVDGFGRLTEDLPPLDAVEASIELDDRLLRVKHLTGRFGGGEFEAVGEANFRSVRDFELDAVCSGRRVQLRDIDGVSVLADFNLSVTGSPDGVGIAGDVWLAQARYTRPFQIVRSIFSSTPTLDVPAPPGPLDAVRLDLDVDAPGNVWLDNDLGRAEFDIHANLRGTVSQPVLDGDLQLVQAGRLRFQKMEYTLRRGTLTFLPAFPDDPEVDAEATADLAPFQVTVEASGRLSQLRLVLSSRPPLPEEEIAGMLLTGGIWRSGGNSGATSIGTSGSGPASLSEWAEPGVNPMFSEAQDTAGSALNLGTRISPRLYAAWSTTLGGAGESALELRYRVLPHLEIRQAREFSGTNLTELRYVRTYDTRGLSNEEEAKADRGAPASPPPLRLTGIADPSLAGRVRETLQDALPAAEVEEGELLVAVARAHRVLAEEDHPLARGSCEMPGGGEEAVSCAFDPGPRVELVLEGIDKDRTARRLREDVLARWLQAPFLEEFAPEAESAALRFFRDKGRAGVTAEAVLEREDERSHVVRVIVDPGPVVRCKEVRLQGIEQLEREAVLDVLVAAHRIGLRHPPVTDDMLDTDRETLRRLHYAAGFLDVKVLPPEVIPLEKKGNAAVLYSVREGPRYVLRTVRIEDNKVFDDHELLTIADIEPGDYPDPAALEKAAVSIQREYLQNGYADTAVQWTLRREAGSEHAATAVFGIREGQLVRIGTIRLEGIETVRPATVWREIRLQSGDLFRRDRLLELQRDIQALRMFDTVSVRGETRADNPAIRDITIRVRERDNIDLAVGAGFDDEEGPRFSFALGQHLVRGRPTSTSLQARLGGDIKVGQLVVDWRRIRGSRYGFVGAIGLGEFERDGYTELTDFLSVQLYRQVSRRTTALARYRVEDIELKDVTLTLPSTALAEGVLASVGLSVVRNSLDDAFEPRDGSLVAGDVSWFPEALGSEEHLWRVAVGARKYRRFPRLGGMVGELGMRLGFAWPLQETEFVPLTERFLAGGIGSVRGYKRDFLGPLDEVTGDPIGGESLMVLNAEMRVPLGGGFNFHLFADGGNAFLSADDFDLSDLKYSVGPGLSLSTPAGPLRVYYGFKLDPEPGEDDGRFHFTFGRTF